METHTKRVELVGGWGGEGVAILSSILEVCGRAYVGV